MSRLSRLFPSLVLSGVLCLSVSSPAFGQDKNGRDLNDFSCKDVMRLSGTDRDVAIGVLHAYLMGKSGTTQYNVEKVSAATEKFIDHCLDNPTVKAVEAMTKARQ